MAFSQQEVCISAFDTFESTYQRSYSHGLEKIYALENVDIRSVRKISAPTPFRLENHSKKVTSKPSKRIIEQLEFCFEATFQQVLAPFIFREPVQVLCLTKKIEKYLFDQDKLTVGDLLEDDKQTLIPLKSLGQGHLDEIVTKLHNYLEEFATTKNSPRIEFTSWMKTLVADLDAKKCAVLLETFQLPPLVPLSPSENAEIRKLTNEKCNQWIKEAMSECRTPSKKQQLNSDLQNITNVYLKPWLRKRGSIASVAEVHEYLLKLSGDHPHAIQILEFISHVYFDQKFPFAVALLEIDEELYCDSTETADIYNSIIKTTFSYFYKDDLHYPLDSLIKWISYEHAKKWQGFSDNFIERILRLSSNFRVRKNGANQLTVKLS
ncbi:MAG: hypothetical protein H0W50_02000 [Parachlamydiaceae bacterium]|nr:hypothetical protein [Parachlamydiaceae bacterium]